MPIKHSTTKNAGDTLLASEWNADHTVPAHSELSGIGENDHHNRLHGFNSANDHTPISASAGDNVIASNPRYRQISSTNYTKAYGCKVVGYAGTFRCHMKISIYDSSNTAYGKIYRNGAAVGSEHSTTSTSGVEFSDDISGWSSGDNVELYVKTSGTYSVRAHYLTVGVA